MDKKPVVFSGIKPTGSLHLGHYIGAIRNWRTMLEDNDCIFCVVDMHALTVRNDPAKLRADARQILALYLACGLDPQKCVLYCQSHAPEHAELSWILSCYTYMGELSRMTQFKDKSRKTPDNINAGLFTYPVLMAADILLFGTDAVPVGDDQKQHLELARDVAIRFNNEYGPTFAVPEPYIAKVGARVMNLLHPEDKMSKSDEDTSGCVELLDSPETVMRKFKRAVTDSGSEVRFSEDKPGVANLMTIYSCVTGKPFADIESEFSGKGYGAFKDTVGQAVAEALHPIQAEYARIHADKAYLNSIMAAGAKEASRRAARVLSKVRKKVGLAPPEY